MDVRIGLPIAAPDTLHTWAECAEAGPFSTLGLLDRLVYDNPEPLITLAVLAGATSRIRVQTEVLLAPLRDTALLAEFADLGADEVMLYCHGVDPHQVDRLAELL